MKHGFARRVSRSLAECQLLNLPRQSIDRELAQQQHAAYVSALEGAGVRMTVLSEEPDLPDATFVEDVVVILDEAAVLCRPGSLAREREVSKVEPWVSEIRPIHRIVAPGTLEGGDVLKVGKTLYVGLSSRTNAEGIRQFDRIATRFGYRVVPVSVSGCLHLKTGVTSPDEGVLLGNPDWVDPAPFEGFEILPVPVGEPWGANTLAANATVFVPSSNLQTAEFLGERGLKVKVLDVSELQKAEAGLTCLSVLY